MEQVQLKKGYVFGALAYLIWGFLAIYWRQLTNFTSLEVLSVRIIMTVVILLIIINIRQMSRVKVYLTDRKILGRLMLTALLITVNWGLYVYAASHGQLLQASLGYFINPLFSMLLGVVILKEKMTLPQQIAVFIAFCGVVYMTVFYGEFPWIGMTLAFSFGTYGLIKKTMNLDSLNSLFIEVLLVSPIAILYMTYSVVSGRTNIFGASTFQWVLVALAGVATFVPLTLFTEGVKRIPLAAIGFLQYITPTMMLFFGAVMYHEPFGIHKAVSFIMIWIGIIVYSISLFNRKEEVHRF